MSTEAISATEAREQFLKMIKEASREFARFIITHRGKPEAVMLSFNEFEGWLETLDISENPSWKKALAKAKREDRSGKRLSFEDVVGRPQRKRFKA